MAIFIKLLATKIVANSFFGLSKSFEIIPMLFEFSKASLFKSDFVNEKIATSAPEIRAEQKSKTIRIAILAIKEVFNSANIIIKLLGSGSKI
jgi:hypothetical protein